MEEMGSVWVYLVSISIGLMGVIWVLKKINGWVYESKLGVKVYSLPPGDLGWPFIGNMMSFFKAFKSSQPDSFLDSYISRFGNTGAYKTFMFGSPSIIVTTPENCKAVLTDDEYFQPGWPKATLELIGKKSFVSIEYEEHKRLRRLTAAPINGHEALSVYLGFIEEMVKEAFEKWSTMGEIEFLTQTRKLTFKIIMYIFLSSESQNVLEALEREYTKLNYGIRAMAINLPGFAYYNALKARKNLVAILQTVVDERRRHGKSTNKLTKKQDMMDNLINVEDENGRKLTDEEVIDILIMYLNAGHESSGHVMVWSTIFLQENPEFLQKAKEEQERIVKKRPATQQGLSLKEIRESDYLSNVVDETMRLLTFSLTVFREAKKDANVGGYLIPKGWKILVWFRSVHFDPKVYPDPRKFNPSRWEGFIPKAGSFLPFGAGTRLCPGNDLGKLEVSVFLHYFVRFYQMKRKNPDAGIRYLPHSRPMDNCVATIKKL